MEIELILSNWYIVYVMSMNLKIINEKVNEPAITHLAQESTKKQLINNSTNNQVGINKQILASITIQSAQLQFSNCFVCNHFHRDWVHSERWEHWMTSHTQRFSPTTHVGVGCPLWRHFGSRKEPASLHLALCRGHQWTPSTSWALNNCNLSALRLLAATVWSNNTWYMVHTVSPGTRRARGRV